jgi:hypothetical protein
MPPCFPESSSDTDSSRFATATPSSVAALTQLWPYMPPGVRTVMPGQRRKSRSLSVKISETAVREHDRYKARVVDSDASRAVDVQQVLPNSIGVVATPSIVVAIQFGAREGARRRRTGGSFLVEQSVELVRRYSRGCLASFSQRYGLQVSLHAQTLRRRSGLQGCSDGRARSEIIAGAIRATEFSYVAVESEVR